ncbi:hypothetical protein TIFTF001_030213 [Ficus carica]|uniref:O-methyltransferase C-terminal domain-containing protein n=1 Tax=Ficus carica TaxID=3494 RepID=A0AA88DSZ0_FICCA|nr:hypothetical protein TIFTF001_030213 [Ficus carica]
MAARHVVLAERKLTTYVYVVGVEHVGGNMFESVPHGDAILMKTLKNCYKAIPDHGTIIVVEVILPVTPENSFAAKSTFAFDVTMMTQYMGGKERSQQEFLALATVEKRGEFYKHEESPPPSSTRRRRRRSCDHFRLVMHALPKKWVLTHSCNRTTDSTTNLDRRLGGEDLGFTPPMDVVPDLCRPDL